jgi:hexosaminidase
VTPQSAPYSAGGDAALTDGVRGSIDRRGGDWQGYEGDFEATVDLGETVVLRSVKTGFLQNPGYGIILPASVDVQVSEDGVTFSTIATLGHAIPRDRSGAIRHAFETTVDSVRARYVRVTAVNVGDAEGDATWLYVDEIMIR